MRTVAERIAAFSSELRYEDLPAEVIHQVKRSMVDTVGCAFGGYDSEPGRIARAMATDITSKQPATLLCSGDRTSADLAAFANDVMIRYLDWNDGYISTGSGHPSDSISALLAAAEISRATGRELITATVVSFEVFCRIMDSWANKPLGVDHATVGGIASVAGAGRLMGLSQAQLLEAININVASNVALNQTRVGHISNWKACGYANSNRNALFAAEIAKRGMSGPSPVFEGSAGFFKVISREPFEPAPFGGRDRPFGIMECSTKQFPLGQYAQTVVQAAIEARRHLRDINEIAEIRIHTVPAGIKLMADSADKWRPRSRETADHSIPYCACIALCFGAVEPHHFEERFREDPRIIELINRVKCLPSDEALQRELEMNLCDFELVLTSGDVRSVRVEYHRGHWRNPMSDDEMAQKLTVQARPLLKAAKVDALLDSLWALDELNDIEALIRMTKIEA